MQGFSLKIVLYAIGIVSIFLTLIPNLPVDNWWIRMFDFPQLQITIITFIAMIAFALKFSISDDKEYLFMGALIGCFIYQLTFLYPYTFIHKHTVLDSSNVDQDKLISLYTANVLQKNKEYNLLIKQIDSINPDILLLTETDHEWRKEIKKNFNSDYRFTKEIPLPNTYGMLLYSKLELVNPKVNFLVDDSIPSIHSKVVLKTGDTIQLYCIHPTPPMPQENPKSTERDTEMMLTAKLSRESPLPVIVLGDFNDVAWSDTTELFRQTGELLDVRIGRGLYCSFDANNPILRWPLDHLFISEEFRLKEIDLCPDINSDHFPFYSRLSFEPEKAEEQKPNPPTERQLKNANDQIEKFKKKPKNT